MKLISIFLVLFLINYTSANDCFCSDITCAAGLTCSEELKHCVCNSQIDYTSHSIINLPATVYDFKADGVYFDNDHPANIIVDTVLGFDDNPVFLEDAANLNNFYNYVPGLNMVTDITLQIVKADGVYHLSGLDYFPIDDKLLGNEGLQHNYQFTTKAVWSIDYNGGGYIYIRYDDGILIYVNRQLIINQPNLHYNGSTILYLDDVAAKIGLAPGYTYPMHIFHSEKHLWQSMLDITTNVVMHPATCTLTCENDKQCQNGTCDPIQRICKCFDGWSGPTCDVGVCKNVDCGQNRNNGRGTCNPHTGKCICKEGWGGSKCDLKTCNYRGQVDTNNVCQCDYMYTGDNCDKCVNSTTVTINNQVKNLYNLCQQRGSSNSNSWKLVTVGESDYSSFLGRSDCSNPGRNNLDCACQPHNLNYGNIDDDDDYGDDEEYSSYPDYTIPDPNYNYNNQKRAVEQPELVLRSSDIINSTKESVSDSLYYQRRIDILTQTIETNSLSSDSSSTVVSILILFIVGCYHFLN